MFWYLISWHILILWWQEVYLIHSKNPDTPFSFLLCERTLLCWLCNMGRPMQASIILLQTFTLWVAVDNPSTFFVKRVIEMFLFSVINHSNVISSEMVLVGQDILLCGNEQLHTLLHLSGSGKILVWLEHTVYQLYPGSDFVWHFKESLIVDFLENVLEHHHSHSPPSVGLFLCQVQNGLIIFALKKVDLFPFSHGQIRKKLTILIKPIESC